MPENSLFDPRDLPGYIPISLTASPTAITSGTTSVTFSFMVKGMTPPTKCSLGFRMVVAASAGGAVPPLNPGLLPPMTPPSVGGVIPPVGSASPTSALDLTPFTTPPTPDVSYHYDLPLDMTTGTFVLDLSTYPLPGSKGDLIVLVRLDGFIDPGLESLSMRVDT